MIHINAEHLLRKHGYDIDSASADQCEEADEVLERNLEMFLDSYIAENGSEFAFEVAQEVGIKKKVKA